MLPPDVETNYASKWADELNKDLELVRIYTGERAGKMDARVGVHVSCIEEFIRALGAHDMEQENAKMQAFAIYAAGRRTLKIIEELMKS